MVYELYLNKSIKTINGNVQKKFKRINYSCAIENKSKMELQTIYKITTAITHSTQLQHHTKEIII